MRQSTGSLRWRPKNWMLYGTLSDEKPDGMQIAGVPARFMGIVKTNRSLSGGLLAAETASRAA